MCICLCMRIFRTYLAPARPIMRHDHLDAAALNAILHGDVRENVELADNIVQQQPAQSEDAVAEQAILQDAAQLLNDIGQLLMNLLATTECNVGVIDEAVVGVLFAAEVGVY